MKNGVKLNGRILWFDGDSSFEEESLYSHILNGGKLDDTIHVLEESEDVIKYNNLVIDSPLTIKTELKEIPNDWNIPNYYLNIDLREYMYAKLADEIDLNDDLSPEDIDIRIERVNKEINLFEEHQMSNILRTVIYITDTFKQKNVIWGTGRGSSCCCYCLYLIELHDVDSVLFNLDLNEFFRI